MKERWETSWIHWQKIFFVEDFIGDREDVLRSIELLQMELDNFVNQHTDEDLQEAAPEVQNEVGYLLYTLGKVSI